MAGRALPKKSNASRKGAADELHEAAKTLSSHAQVAP
jgi:hypothetical protein